MCIPFTRHSPGPQNSVELRISDVPQSRAVVPIIAPIGASRQNCEPSIIRTALLHMHTFRKSQQNLLMEPRNNISNLFPLAQRNTVYESTLYGW